MRHRRLPERGRLGRVATRLAALAVVLTGCGSSTTASGTVNVVAAENVWGDIAAQVGSGHVAVSSLITDPNADPHRFESDARTAAAVASATLVIENGAGYDDWMDRLISGSGVPTSRVLDVATLVGVGGDNPNPHLWYDPGFVTRAARAIESRFAALQPANAGAFAANLTAFLTSYAPYAATIATLRARHRGVPVGYTERVAGYLAQAAGLTLATPASFAQAIEDGNDPAPGDVATMRDVIAGHNVDVLLYNAQVVNAATTAVRSEAVAAGVPVVGVAETLPAAYRTFQAWQVAQARAILAALGG